MPARTDARLDCPQCRSPLVRVRRAARDKVAPAPNERRRYRCVADGCEWQGQLPRRVRRPRQLLLRGITRTVQRALLPAAAISGLSLTIAAVAWQAGLFSPPAQRGFALGEHHDGEQLPNAHPLARHHARAQRVVLNVAASAVVPGAAATVAPPADGRLQLRYGCVWGEPGRQPYQGGVEQALRSAALPDEVVKSIAAQVHAGQSVDTLEIRNDGVYAKASGRVYSAQNIALSYGRTLCLGSRVNFKAGHSEPAALYEAATRDGRVVAVMVPAACGNVSVLGQTDASVRAMRLAGASDGSEDTMAARWMPAVLDGAGGTPVAGAASDVPEPGTLALVVAALLGWGAARRWRLARA